MSLFLPRRYPVGWLPSFAMPSVVTLEYQQAAWTFVGKIENLNNLAASP